MKIVLFEPQIPQNTGNIVRTCAVTGAGLVLVEPLGFRPTDRMLKRAGLDYWLGVDVQRTDDLEAYLENIDVSFYFFSSKATTRYTDISYTPNDLLIFGSETSGLPPHFHARWPDRFVTIPMIQQARCLNLSNAAAIALYEAWRQNHFH